MKQLADVIENVSNNYKPSKAYSSVYVEGVNRFLVEGHHTTVAFKMLGKEGGINMNMGSTKYPPSAI